MRSATGTLALAALLLLTIAGCGREQARTEAAATTATTATSEAVARGRVDVEGGELPLGMAVDGIIANVRVKEGDRVRKGQVLASVDATAANIDTELAQARLTEAQAQSKLQLTRVGVAKIRAARLAEAAKRDAGDRQSADDAREALAQASAEADNADAGVHTARAELERARHVTALQQLRAPIDGDVLRITAATGMRVSAQGAPLVTLLPARARIVRAELAEDLVDGVAPGQRARILSDDGRLTVLGSAHVLRLGSVYGPLNLQQDPQERVNERIVECVLAFDEPVSLRVGRRVLVRFEAKGPDLRAGVPAR